MSVCKECGALFDEQLAECPYCGALNYQGAEASYMEHLEKVKEDLEEMGDDSREEYTSSMKKHTKVVLISFVAAFIVIGVIFSVRMLLDHMIYNPQKEAEEHKAQLIWSNEYYDDLDAMYLEKDYDGILAFMEEHASDKGYYLNDWEHIDYILMYEHYCSLKESAASTDADKIASCLYDAVTIDFALNDDYKTYTEDETANIKQWQSETNAYYCETLGMTEEEIASMKETVAFDHKMQFPSWSKCSKYAKKHFRQ